MRKPYICRYSEKVLEEINHAVDGDASIPYVQNLCQKYDKNPDRPSYSQVSAYIKWYKDQKRQNWERARLMGQTTALDGIDELIEKARNKEPITREDVSNAIASGLAMLKSQINACQMVLLAGHDVDTVNVLTRQVEDIIKAVDTIGKNWGTAPDQGGKTEIIIQLQQGYKELYKCVMKAIAKTYPQLVKELEVAIQQEVDSYLKAIPQQKTVDVKMISQKKGDPQ